MCFRPRSFTGAGSERAVPVEQGIAAHLLGGPARQELKAPQMVVFLDKGRRDGVATGDIFEIRRTPEELSDGSIRVDEVMATMQVVHVRERTATARLLQIISPDITIGATVRQVAKLPSWARVNDTEAGGTSRSPGPARLVYLARFLSRPTPLYCGRSILTTPATSKGAVMLRRCA